MKILALTNLYPPHYLGGYELICYHVLGALQKRGHTISVLTSDFRSQPNPHEPEYQSAAFRPLQLPILPKRRNLKRPEGRAPVQRSNARKTFTGNSLFASPEDPLSSNPCNVSSVERSLQIHGFYGRPWLNIWNLRHLERHNNLTLTRALEMHQPDLVYVWNMGGLSKSMLFTLQRANAPVVFYLSDHWIARGLASDVWLRWWNRSDAPFHHRIVRALLAQVGVRDRWQSIAPTNPPQHFQFQRIYFCSRALRDRAVEAGFPVEHAAIIHCPVDVQKFAGNPKPPHHPLRQLLCAGRLAPDKGIMTALRAMIHLRGQFHGSLTICGRGNSDYERPLRKFAVDNSLPVTFTAASMNEMPQVYRTADALLFTSEWDEPFALTPLEAMASGLPVIATTTGGSAELFRHDQNALTYTAGRSDELADRILQLAQDPALRMRIATTGYCEVRTRFAEPIIVDQIEDYLEETRRVWRPILLPAYDA